MCATAAHFERLVRAWRRVDRIAEAEDDRRRHASRHLETWVDEDGMLVVRGRLTPEIGAVVQRALEAASDRALFDATYLTPELRPWSPNVVKRLVRTPKRMFVDTGLLSRSVEDANGADSAPG